MSEVPFDDVPEADALEQSMEVDPGEATAAPAADPEVPEADALEQAMEVDRGERATAPVRDPEVPEADALDQAIEVPDEDGMAVGDDAGPAVRYTGDDQ